MPTANVSRVARSAPATLTHAFVVGETLTDVDSGSVTLTLTDANGTVVVNAATATHAGLGTYTYAMAGQSQLADYTAAWSGLFGGSTVTETDHVQIVGGFFFNLLTARTSDPVNLADPAKFSTAMLDRVRQEVEDECEMICDRAFVPRYRRMVLNGTGTTRLLLTDPEWAAEGRSIADVRTVRSVLVAPQLGQTFVALTAGELAACAVMADGSLKRVDGNIWTEGTQNVIVELEFGLDAPPSDLVTASLTRLRDRLAIAYSAIPDRATSFHLADGGAAFRLDMPDTFKTGLPMVDAVYARYSRREGAGTGKGRKVPVSRTLTYDPQTYSMFHNKYGPR